MPRDLDQGADANARPQAPVSTSPSGSTSWIAFLETLTPFVQAFDFVLMLIAGVYCLRSTRSRKNIGLTILGISCFVSAIILLGFFLFAFLHGRGATAQSAYVIARLLAPFELLLFFIGIVIIARRNLGER